MTRMIFCTFLQRQAIGHDTKFYPGKLGERIYNEISIEAWIKWRNRQTILINDYRLNMINPKHRQFLKQEMIKFLFKNKSVTINN